MVRRRGSTYSHVSAATIHNAVRRDVTACAAMGAGISQEAARVVVKALTAILTVRGNEDHSHPNAQARAVVPG